ncbi:unnamed protein product, partial [Durusdinium trenchii]
MDDSDEERYRRSRSPSFTKAREETRSDAKSHSLRRALGRVVSKLQDKEQEKQQKPRPQPPKEAPPSLRSRVEQIVRRSQEWEQVEVEEQATPSPAKRGGALELLKSKV